jgi:hypothetical protein
VILAEIVDVESLVGVILSSFVAAVGASVAFSLAIVGATRMVENRRDSRGIEAGAYAALMIIGLVLSGAAVVFGVIIMTTK